jgi:tRNA1(Val) A37 N6-methylase TrmN6
VITLLNGAVKMVENKCFPNPSEDGIWLAKHLPIHKKEKQLALDVGCGTGVATLCAQSLFPHICLTGMDIQEDALHLAKENASLNKFNIDWIKGDIQKPPFQPESFDIVFSNPPFHLVEKGFNSAKNNQAFATTQNDTRLWTTNMLKLAKEGGIISLVNHVHNLPIFESFSSKYAVTVTELKTSPNKPAKRIIAHIDKGKPPTLEKKEVALY